MLETAIFILLAYLLGAMPIAYVLGKRVKGIDITQVGSRNVGALNAWRTLGWRLGLTVLIFDIGKGIIVITLILGFGLSGLPALFMAIAVTLGHNFSIFLNFKGGKGVAVVFGISFVVLPLLTLLAIVIIFFSYLFTKSIVWSFLVGFIALNVLTVTTGQPGAQVGLCLVLSFVVLITHIWRARKDLIPSIRNFDLSRIGQIE